MRIAFLLSDLAPSGGLRAVLELGAALQDRGHRVTVVSSSNADVLHGFATRVDIRSPPGNAKGPRKDVPGRIRQYLRAIACIPPADVLVATYYSTAYAAIIAKAVGRHRGHLAYFAQDDESLFPQGRYAATKRQMARLSYRLPLQILANSRWTASQVRGHGARAVDVVGLGLDRSTFRPASRPERSNDIVMTVGRSQPHKAYSDFCVAMQLVCARRPQTRCLVATQQSVALPDGVPGDVVRPRDDSELVACYRRACVYVCSSLQEGFGLPGLEALACGTPLVTTDCGGVSEYARQREDSLLVPPREPAALAAAILEVLEQPDLGRRLGDAGPRTAERFDWQNTAERFEHALEARMR